MSLDPITISRFPDTLAAERLKTNLKITALSATVVGVAAIAFKTSPLWVPPLIASGPIGWTFLVVLGGVTIGAALFALRIILSPATIDPAARLTSVTFAAHSIAVDTIYDPKEVKKRKGENYGYNGDFAYAHQRGIAIQLDTVHHGITEEEYKQRKNCFDQLINLIDNFLKENADTYTLQDLQKMLLACALKVEEEKVNTTFALSAIFERNGQKYLAAIYIGDDDVEIRVYDKDTKLRGKIKGDYGDFGNYRAKRAKWTIYPINKDERVVLSTDGCLLSDEEFAETLKASDNNAENFINSSKKLIQAKIAKDPKLKPDDISIIILTA